MSLSTRITEEITAAMKNRDGLRLETLRSIRARLLEFEKSGAGREANSEEEQQILIKEAKKRKDAAEQYANAGRAELQEKELAELEIIQEFLPKQLNPEDVKTAVREIIQALGAQGPGDFGKVMGAAMKQLRGKADGALVQQLVKSLLA